MELKDFRGNLIISLAAVASSFLSKKIFKKEFIPVSSSNQIFYSMGGIFFATVVGKIIILYMDDSNVLGFDKKENEGFIGPFELNDFFYGPDRKNRQIIQGMKKDNRRGGIK